MKGNGDELDRARGRTIPDVLGPRPRILFCGINPSLTSGTTGYHFAHPGNRFWSALYGAGLTPRLLRPDEQAELPAYGLGITNLVARATGRADELTSDELRAGWQRLRRLVERYEPAWVAVVGVTAYRTATGIRTAAVGPQSDTLAGARLWVLPNPSGLNAHYTPADLAAEFRRLAEAVHGYAGGE